MRNVIGLYARLEDALNAMQALTAKGFRKEDMTLIASDPTGRYARTLEDAKIRHSQDLSDGTAAGASIGGLIGGIGGLLLGLGTLAIPGIGPVLAAGPVISTLVGAGAGAAAGGLVGALIDLGVPDSQAQVYVDGLRRGGTLLITEVDEDHSEEAAEVMNRFHPLDLDKKAPWWHEDMAGLQYGNPNTGRESLTETLARQDNQPFAEWSVEYREVREEPVIDKEARVVEEVRVYKDSRQRDATIHDTVRRQVVDIEREDGEADA